MHVDQAGDQSAAGRVDHLGLVRRGQLRPDSGDPLAVDQQPSRPNDRRATSIPEGIGAQ